jgi:hypothetical protein
VAGVLESDEFDCSEHLCLFMDDVGLEAPCVYTCVQLLHFTNELFDLACENTLSAVSL